MKIALVPYAGHKIISEWIETDRALIWGADLTEGRKTWAIYGPHFQMTVWHSDILRSAMREDVDMVEISPNRFFRASRLERATARARPDGDPVIRLKMMHNDWRCDVFKDWPKVAERFAAAGRPVEIEAEVA